MTPVFPLPKGDATEAHTLLCTGRPLLLHDLPCRIRPIMFLQKYRYPLSQLQLSLEMSRRKGLQAAPKVWLLCVEESSFDFGTLGWGSCSLGVLGDFL